MRRVVLVVEAIPSLVLVLSPSRTLLLQWHILLLLLEFKFNVDATMYHHHHHDHPGHRWGVAWWCFVS